MRLEYQDNYPVYARHNGVDAEAAGSMIVLSPDCVAMMVPCAVSRRPERVHSSSDDEEEP